MKEPRWPLWPAEPLTSYVLLLSLSVPISDHIHIWYSMCCSVQFTLLSPFQGDSHPDILLCCLFLQIKSDKIFTGEVIYKLEGPGVDQDPKNLFEIDDKTGWIRSMIPLDREKYRSFTVQLTGETLALLPLTRKLYYVAAGQPEPFFCLGNKECHMT